MPSPYTVVFDLPANIEAGLAAGTLERIGGVIRTQDSKQIVAWLREGITTDASSTALAQLAPSLAGLTSLAAAGQLLQLSVTMASLQTINRRLDHLSNEIDRLGEMIRAEFKRDRDVEFKSALRQAEIASKYESTRKNELGTVIGRLYTAYENLRRDYETALDTDLTLAQHYLLRAIYASTSRIRCRLEQEDLTAAKDDLHDDLEFFETAVRELVNRWLGEHPARFLHPALDRAALEQFVAIQDWLHPAASSTPQDIRQAILAMLDRLRGDFWNDDALPQNKGNVIQQLARRPVISQDEQLAALSFHLDQAAILIENLQRLQGFDLELRTLRLSFADWQTLIPETDLAAHGLGIILNDDSLSA